MELRRRGTHEEVNQSSTRSMQREERWAVEEAGCVGGAPAPRVPCPLFRRRLWRIVTRLGRKPHSTRCGTVARASQSGSPDEAGSVAGVARRRCPKALPKGNNHARVAAVAHWNWRGYHGVDVSRVLGSGVQRAERVLPANVGKDGVDRPRHYRWTRVPTALLAE